MKRLRDFFKRNRSKLLISLIVVLAISGLVLILFPIYTNIVVARRESEVLSSWEELKEEETGQAQEISEDEVITIEKEDVEETEQEIIEPTEELGEPVDDYTIEEIFPLKMTIPEIDSELIVNAGSDVETLKKGPGYIIGTSLPGQPGRCAISGHRTTYGAPFNRVDELERGDMIYLESITGIEFEYVVKQQVVVNPEDIYILEGDERPELLLTTCTPKFSASKRLIIIAELLDYYKLESYYN